MGGALRRLKVPLTMVLLACKSVSQYHAGPIGRALGLLSHRDCGLII